eukprot:CAMPEP_0202825586 /NCGR_PEP_ID=MMETSP1389-20130828/13121_1 /ASSEMBLY_ACC=CAM_ASM_000865 /TAXON_ID=302021 /ORGANISM="Rhodomonas sp., Strain CCMP768" /LENGTH=245 /DNA_ID=CAMNT_0049498827 /DNA_START=94 /DNA_END=832 /DNA_ORIENTATION=-
MDVLMFDENRTARTRPAGKAAQPLQLSSGGFPSSAGKQMQTPRRRALGDITNGRSNTPSQSNKTPGASLRKQAAQTAAAVVVQPSVWLEPLLHSIDTFAIHALFHRHVTKFKWRGFLVFAHLFHVCHPFSSMSLPSATHELVAKVEEVDTAKRISHEEEPFSDAWFEEGIQALNRFAASQTHVTSSRSARLPPAPPPPTPCFEAERRRDQAATGAEEEEELDMVLEEAGGGGAFDDFELDLPLFD